jgi:hypothetical protein
MKARIGAFLVLFLLGTPALFGQATVQSRYNEGVALFNQEKYGEALMAFEEVLQASPNHVYARSYAMKSKSAIAKGTQPKNDLEGRLARIIIPQIAFAEAPLGDVLDFFSVKAEEISGGQTTVNFIFNGTPEQRSGTLITLSVRNIPMTEAIRYVTQLSNTRAKYEPHAVVIDAGAAPAAAAPAATTEAGAAKKLFD